MLGDGPMRNLIICATALVMTSPLYAQTIPQAPQLTAGAEFKGLRFDWEPVAGATWYELEYKANQSAAFVKKGSNLPASATSYEYRFPLHLFDWTYARYRLAACNAAGCARSAEISVSNLRRDAVGYFKASNSTSDLAFGSDTDITPDGLNFVAAAPGETSDSSGLPPAVYVFRRGSAGEWLQRARLLPPEPPVQSTDYPVMKVQISADGNTVVLGMPNYPHGTVEEGALDDVSGEVFIFHFNGTSWVRSRLYAGAGSRGSFGRWVSVNDAGDLIALGSGESVDPSIPRHAFIYRKVDGAWHGVRDIQARPGSEYCDNGALSADGSTLVQNCREVMASDLGGVILRNYVRTNSGPNWTVREVMELEMAAESDFGRYSFGLAVDRTGSTIAAQIYMDAHGGDGAHEVHVFHRDGAYLRVAKLTPGAWQSRDLGTAFGFSVAISDDGSTIAVGDTFDTGRGTGPRAAPLLPGGPYAGAVYVYRLKNTWRLANMVKPNYLPVVPGNYIYFGDKVSLSGNGQTLIVGEKSENSAAQGIGGDWTSEAAPQSGAVWMY
jgi:hypothetical protein